MEIVDKYYNKNILIHMSVIKDIVSICNSGNIKMLVFGLGYDSELWFNLTGGDTYFVEDNDVYISLNKTIPNDHIIKYKYNTTVRTSFNLSDEQLDKFEFPPALKEQVDKSNFDVIIIDGPNGHMDHTPGRILPIYWAKKYLLEKNKTMLFIDDANRKLESFAINKYFGDYNKIIFNDESGCIKIIC
jgi:hypothetical protein